MPLVVDPVIVASSGARLLEDDAVDVLVGRLFPLATVVTPNLLEARALTGSDAAPPELAEALVGLGARAALITGGHGDESADHLFDGSEHHEIRFERHDVAATHGAGCTHSATLAAFLARGVLAGRCRTRRRGRGVPCRRAGAGRDRRGRRAGRRSGSVGAMTVSPGTTLRELRERKPLVHQITNYVVMNETANATLALGALPVMAHAPRGGRGDGRSRIRARAQHRHALGALDRSDAHRRARGKRPRHPRRPRSRGCRRDEVPHRDGTADPRRGGRDRAAREPGRGRDARRCAGRGARRRVDVDRARARRARARGGARPRRGRVRDGADRQRLRR